MGSPFTITATCACAGVQDAIKTTATPRPGMTAEKRLRTLVSMVILVTLVGPWWVGIDIRYSVASQNSCQMPHSTKSQIRRWSFDSNIRRGVNVGTRPPSLAQRPVIRLDFIALTNWYRRESASQAVT